MAPGKNSPGCYLLYKSSKSVDFRKVLFHYYFSKTSPALNLAQTGPDEFEKHGFGCTQVLTQAETCIYMIKSFQNRCPAFESGQRDINVFTNPVIHMPK